MDDPTGSWLVRTEADRARMLEAGSRVRVSRLVVAIVLGVALLILSPWLGPWPLAFIAVGTIQVATLDHRLKASDRPERLVALSLMFTAVMVASTVAVTGGPQSPVLPWFVVPAGLMANRFRPQVVITGVLIEVVMLVGVCLAVDARGLIDDPALTLCSLTVLACIVIITLSLSDTEMALRADARFDHLTGLMNRAELDARFSELRGHAHATGTPIALVVYDLDRFKRVNDELGHDVGDAVLRDVAGVLRGGLRSVDLVYRLGGEEFAVVLPGATAEQARDAAERQRRMVAASHPGGVEITISGGVAAAQGTDVDWDTLFRRADGALLEAKRAGRDRIVSAPAPVDLPVAA
jgi:diguanylate cyclase (GGDEF)-like protein